MVGEEDIRDIWYLAWQNSNQSRLLLLIKYRQLFFYTFFLIVEAKYFCPESHSPVILSPHLPWSKFLRATVYVNV